MVDSLCHSQGEDHDEIEKASEELARARQLYRQQYPARKKFWARFWEIMTFIPHA